MKTSSWILLKVDVPTRQEMSKSSATAPALLYFGISVSTKNWVLKNENVRICPGVGTSVVLDANGNRNVRRSKGGLDEGRLARWDGYFGLRNITS